MYCNHLDAAHPTLSFQLYTCIHSLLLFASRSFLFPHEAGKEGCSCVYLLGGGWGIQGEEKSTKIALDLLQECIFLSGGYREGHTILEQDVTAFATYIFFKVF